jgi:DNA mismatch endonuclease (patch repair protein)
MVDVVSSGVRSRMMAGIRRRDTAPELAVRRYLHAAGLRFRVDCRQLPGAPDLVFAKYRVALFVHGCFWHRHGGCRFATSPTSRAQFWSEKFDANVRRDRDAEARLRMLGWNVIVAWECETRDVDFLDQLFWQIVSTNDQLSANSTQIKGALK